MKWSKLGSAELRRTTPSPSAKVHTRGSGESQDRHTRRGRVGQDGPHTPYAVPPGLFCFFLHGGPRCHLTSRPPDGDSRQADSLPLHHVRSLIHFEC